MVPEKEPEPEEKKFKVIEGWLDKKSGSLPKSWRPRWVVVKESWLLWADIEHHCGDPNDEEERKHFTKAISLLQVDNVERIDGKSGKEKRAFKVVVNIGGDKKKEYLFRAKDEQKRNRWSMELKYRIEHYKSKVDPLATGVAEIYSSGSE